MTSQIKDPALRDRVTVVVTAVRAVEPDLSPHVIEAALLKVAPTPHLWTRIAKFLTAHPEALTTGSSRTPKAVGHLIATLTTAGATRLVMPHCADCGQPKELFHTVGEDRICVSCYDRRHQQSATCGACGNVKPVKAHGPDGTPRCQACQHKSRRTACTRCGRIRPFNVSKTDGKPYCRGCRARNHLEECAGCGNNRPVNTRDADGRALCGTCYATQGLAPRAACSQCGAPAPVAAHTEDGAPVCQRCYRHPTRTCGVCGRTRRVALRATDSTPDVCPTCYQAPEITCSVCGTTDLGRRTTAEGRPM